MLRPCTFHLLSLLLVTEAITTSHGLARHNTHMQPTRTPTATARRTPHTPTMLDSCLIIQNKGGGHGEIGYHLALLLRKRNIKTTILHEGPNKNKPPHDSYADLDDAGVDVHWCDDLADAPACLAKLGGATYDAVVDNWSKEPELIAPYAEQAKAWGVDHYAFVSSAGMYTPDKGDFSAIDEACAVKSSGQRKAEEKLAEMGLPYTYFRPQYIYGPKQGKSYLGYFFDRITRDMPVPVPGDGTQPVTFTHAFDNAAMIDAAIGNDKAVGEAFNCATSKTLTYDELVALCAGAAGKEVNICHFDPKAAGVTVKELGFPFRETPFYVSADKAANLLGWAPAHKIDDDIGWYFSDQYKAKEVDASLDAKATA